MLEPHKVRRSNDKTLWSLGLKNVHPQTTKSEVDALIKSIKYQRILFGKTNTPLSEQQVNDEVKGIFGELAGGDIESFDVVSQSVNGLTKEYVRFAKPLRARRPQAVNPIRQPEIGSNINIEPRVAIRIRILHEIYTIIASDIDALRNDREDGVWISRPALQGVQPVTIRIIGSDASTVGQVRSGIENLLIGTVVINNQAGALWDDHYGTVNGMEELRRLCLPGKVFLYRDLQRKRLVFHGAIELLETTREALKSAISERSR